MEPVITLSRAFDSEIIAVMLTLPRIYAFLTASQLLNSNSIPMLPRTACILSLALFAVPLNMEYASTFDRTAMNFIGYFAKEVAIGFLIGYLVGWTFSVVQGAGGLIDNQRGAAIASSIDPLQGEESSPLGLMFSQVFLTYLFTTGAFMLLLGVLYRSYVLWPATKAVPIISDQFPVMALQLFDYSMRTAIVMAAPIVAIMFVAEFSLAMISRFSPQIQVFVLAMPIKSMLAIIVLIYYFQSLMPFAQQQVLTSRDLTERLYEILRHGETLVAPQPPPKAMP
eukprot:gene20123-20670_t